MVTMGMAAIPPAAVTRATTRADRLAYYLHPYNLEELCTRLHCDGETALRLQLHAVPDAYEWGHSVRTIARLLGLSIEPLDQLLREALTPAPSPTRMAHGSSRGLKGQSPLEAGSTR